MYIIINYFFILLELIDARRDEDITEESRVFFLDKSHRLQEAVVDGDIPSVNIRGTIDPVRGRGRGREGEGEGGGRERGEGGGERRRTMILLLSSSPLLGSYTSI